MASRSVSAGAITKAYIDPIRTVMLVDDKFHTFGELATRRESDGAEAPGTEKQEDERAGELWEACRQRGWACDIENEFSEKAIARIGKCDVVVLDFHLIGIDSAPSCRIMRELADSKGSSLVILYTLDDDLDDVRRRVAAALRGARLVESVLGAEELAAWEELPDGIPSFSAENVDSFLRGEPRYKDDKALRAQFDEQKLPTPLRLKLLEAGLEQYLASAFDAGQTETSRRIQMSQPAAPHGWVRQGNVFIVFVSKLAQKGGGVFDALESALRDSGPSPLHLTAAAARASIAEGGFKLDAKALADVSLRVGLLRHALDEAGLPYWCERVIESVAAYAVETVAEFSMGLIPADSGDGRTSFERAKDLALDVGEPRPSEFEAAVALNEFLCSEAYRGSHLKTGTVFRRADSPKSNLYWVCVTPACDMVPRPPGAEQWEYSLHPLRPLSVLRATEANASTALQNATRGHHLFFVDGDRNLAVRVITEERLPRRETLLVDESGVTDTEGRFFAYHIGKEDDRPSFGEKIRMQAVAQLRTEYASRLLQDAGSHASRIGVDFANHPRTPVAAGPSLAKSPAVLASADSSVEGSPVIALGDVPKSDGPPTSNE